MGCDIHVFAEIKICDNDDWTYFQNINISRNYQLFSKMVPIIGRGNQTPIATERGVPTNASKLSIFMLQHSGEHTFSYLMLNEIHLLIEWIKQQGISSLCVDLLCFIDYMPGYDFFDKRIIFGFDN
jgi:hypothetical protein